MSSRRRPIGLLRARKNPRGRRAVVRQAPKYTRLPRYQPYSYFKGIGIPKSLKVTLRYVQEVTLNPTAGSYAVSTFSANGMYDPWISGTGHQPYQFDQLMALYNNYQVTSSSMKVAHVSTATTNLIPAYIGVIMNSSSSTPSFSSSEHFLECNLRSARVRTTGYFGGALDSTYGQAKQGTVTYSFNAKKYFGSKLDDDHEGTSAGNPTEQAYYHVVAYSIDGNNPDACTLMITIDYSAILTEPVLAGQS